MFPCRTHEEEIEEMLQLRRYCNCGEVFGVATGLDMGREYSLEEIVHPPEGTERCRDHVDAARSGHLHCLAQLYKEGAFLPLSSPEWVSAGEAKKCQVFEAAIAGCSSGLAYVLSWLFSSGWPDIEAIFPWDMRDLLEQHMDLMTAFPELHVDSEPFCLEYKLYCCAVQQATTSCLEALLDAGCRSEWICRIAAREGKADFLALAAKQGCPCDFWVWKFAASTGKLAVLELLASDHAKRSQAASNGAATRNGDRSWILERVGCGERRWALESAVRSGHLQICQCLVHLDPRLLQHPYLFHAAARGGSLPCLDFLQRAGCPWAGDELISAAGSGSLVAVRYCLQRCGDNLQSSVLESAMCQAIKARSPECMQALYDCGYLFPAAERDYHPALNAIMHGSSECLPLAIQFAGRPQFREGFVAWAAGRGEEMLQLVHGLWGKLESYVAEQAASAGQVGALRYALQHGAPLSMITFGAAVEGGSVECLKCAFEHGLAFGFRADHSQSLGHFLRSARLSRRHSEPVTLRFGMLRYICEVMGHDWVQQFLPHAAWSLARSELKGGKDGWKECLYMAQRLEGPLPSLLDELVRVRRERAGALAGVFYKAKKLAQAGGRSPWLALWGVMERVPVDMRERIAFEAHLICPVAQLEPL
eukprot:jgi/Botrbrau1/11968/Bobra.0115s0004.1